MKEKINIYGKKIAQTLKKYSKNLLFVFIFALVCFLYNLNLQTLNFVLNRGNVLIFSINEDSQINKKEIDEKLSDLKIKYSFVESNKPQDFVLDSDNEPVNKLLYIALPYKLDDKTQNLAKEISNFVLDKYQDSKLIEVKTLKNKYDTPYSAFIKFLGILFLSLVIFYGTLFTFERKKINLKENIKNFFSKIKDSISNLFKNTKEQGIKYLVRKIFFDETESEKETSFTKEIISTILFVLICVILIRYFIGELRYIPSGSMRPTIVEGDRVFVEKLDFPKKEIKRGDILVFYPPEVKLSNSPLAIFSRLSGIFCRDIAYIKRTIGLPGEKFEVKYDKITNRYRVYINDKALNEPYINSQFDWSVCNKQMFCGPFIIPENNYFMMGDNRGNSRDSRFWGFLERNRIIGRANFMFFPIKRINILKDKYIELPKQKINSEVQNSIYIINRY